VENKDRTDFFPYDNLGLRSGYFVADLAGPAGTSVTLYGLEVSALTMVIWSL
jgi:hypothetical protein